MEKGLEEVGPRKSDDLATSLARGLSDRSGSRVVAMAREARVVAVLLERELAQAEKVVMKEGIR